jgi:predicted permease
VTWEGQSEQATGELVSGNYFEVLGVQPLLGRTLTPDDDRTRDGHPVAVLTYGYWKRRFGGDPEVLNRSILVNGFRFTIIGIGPPGFSGVQVQPASDILAPLAMQAEFMPGWRGNADTQYLQLVARLKPGVDPRRAESGANVLFAQLLREELAGAKDASADFRSRYLAKHLDLLPAARGLSDLRQQFSKPLQVLMALVALLLFIACANVANLLLARSASREKEIAVRLALGASRARIFRQLLVESMLLASMGGVLGIVLAQWFAGELVGFLPYEHIQDSLSTVPDARVLAFTFAVSLVAGVLFGLAPGWRGARITPSPNAGFRRALVAAQMGFAVLLLVAAGLFARSLAKLRSVDLGLRPDHLLSITLDPARTGYDAARERHLYGSLQQRLSSLPGVRSASMALVGVMTGLEWTGRLAVEGYAPLDGQQAAARLDAVGPDYFRTLGVPLLAGREFTTRDDAGAPPVAIVSESFARDYLGDGNPLGRHIGMDTRPGASPDIEVIGVVRDFKGGSFREPRRPAVFLPIFQRGGKNPAIFYTRTVLPPAETAGAVRRAVRELDAGLPLLRVQTVDQWLDRSIYVERAVALLSAFFGGLAALLAAIGIYGVVGYSVAWRTREIGIRIALGAAQRSVRWLILKEAALMAGIGLVVGLPSAWVLSRLVASQLFGITAHDPLVFGASALLLAAIALGAAYGPAKRAARVEPLSALRYE